MRCVWRQAVDVWWLNVPNWAAWFLLAMLKSGWVSKLDGLTLKDLLGPLVLHFVAMLIGRINGGVIIRDSSVLGGCAAGQFIYCRIYSVSSQMTARANSLRLLWLRACNRHKFYIILFAYFACFLFSFWVVCHEQVLDIITTYGGFLNLGSPTSSKSD